MTSKTVEFDEWELQRVSQQVLSECLVYMGHYSGAGLKREEVVTMNKLFQLRAKLRGEPTPEELPYVGTRGNRWNKNAD